MTLDREEVLRYLRMGRTKPDAALASRIDVVGAHILEAVRPAFCRQLVPVTAAANGVYRVGPLTLSSVDLYRTLRGCSHAFLFCATLGAGVDALVRRYAARSAVDLLIAQASATALIETYCDACEATLRTEADVVGEVFRARFSPGYGDLPLTVQPALLTAVDAARRIGVTLTDALLMVPSKSVSAVIGSARESAVTDE